MAASIAEIIVLALLADWIVRKMGLPGLIGMLATGIILGPFVMNYLSPELLAISSDLRLMALIVILLRAGFELSRSTMHKVGRRALLLSFIPALSEGIVITIAAPGLLGLTVLESAVLATVLAAVSPAVVVPAMIGFIKKKMGADKGIPSMIMAAASVDDVFVIVGHGVVLNLLISGPLSENSSGLVFKILGIPLSLVLGAAGGMLIGVLLYRLFDRFNPRATKRVLIIIAASIFLVRLQHLFEGFLPFAGLVSTMALGFIILEKRENMAHEISAKLAKVWVLAELVLFTLVGAQVNIEVAWDSGLNGLLVLVLGLTGRWAGSLFCLAGSPLDRGERIFVLAAYSPKATVQAAIGASPLIAMKAAGMDTMPGEIILAVAVLSIIVTAPLGSMAIGFTGRRFLKMPVEQEVKTV